MTFISEASVVLDGFKFVDIVTKHEELKILDVDIAIFVIGWEQRSLSALSSSGIKGTKALLVNF